MSKLGAVTPAGSVISNLPLLFADGYPTSLEVITEKQLEQFIVFMMNCSAGRPASCKDPMPVPKWWPDGVDFAFPLVKTSKLEQKWMLLLKTLVTRCYAYHNCKFMLKFCTDLAQCPVPALKFVDQQDGTTALHNKETGKLLVTFRNENRAYDRKVDSPRKYLLLRCPRPVHQQLIDIYLCDSCDAEYETLAQVQEHERVCQPEQAAQTQTARSATPDDSTADLDQRRFLSFFDLHILDANHLPSSSQRSPMRRTGPQRYKRGYPGGVNLSRVPFSSPLGRALQKKVPRAAPYAVTQAHLDRVERYCLPAKTNARDPWIYPYKIGPKRGVRGWVHTYCFNKAERLARALAIETGLSQRARVLLKKCPPLSVSLTKLTDKEIIKYTSRPSKSPTLPPALDPSPRHIPVIDLCSSDDENSNSVKASPLADLTLSVVPPRLNAGRGVSHLLLPVIASDRYTPYLHQLQSDTSPHIFPLNCGSHTSGKTLTPTCESATRTRWIGKIQKNTLASENEIVNGNPKRERRKLDRSKFHECSGVTADTKSKFQSLNIKGENASPTKLVVQTKPFNECC